MKVSELKERKLELGFSNKMISEMSGVPLGTVEKIFSGRTESPRYESLSKIEKALYSEGAEVLSHPEKYDDVDFNEYRVFVNEPNEAYAYDAFYNYDRDFIFNGKRQGQFTVEDYEALPEGIRMELIDGVLYDMAPPTTFHQVLAAETYVQISPHLLSSKGGCFAFLAPFALRFDRNNKKNSFEPDLAIICDKSKYVNNEGKVFGSPDFVMEVLSPSTRAKDQVLKFNKYWEIGVREYWIVDPETLEIRVFVFEKGTPPTTYSFEDKVPIYIFNGKLSVDFAPIYKLISDIGFNKDVGV
ncbi:MAG: Uma2 family endonuclease [Mogibacterium sp.]|nr:Uma2 family endonuclease [Mogibacterium sp.]